MKDKLYKRRPQVNWHIVILDLEDSVLFGYLNKLRCKFKYTSINRLSYLTLLHFYDKRILDYYRFTRDFSFFTSFFDFDKRECF